MLRKNYNLNYIQPDLRHMQWYACLMVSAFCGHDFMMEAYEVAVKEKYRFYSYGDAMLIL